MISEEESFQDPAKFYHPDNWTIESAELEFQKDAYVPIIRVKGLRFHSIKKSPIKMLEDVKPEIIIKGVSFLAPAAVPYYHAVTDVLAHYHDLKKYIPETKIVFCANQIWAESVSGASDDLYPYMKDILDKYAGSFVVDTLGQDILFEEVVFFVNECLWMGDRPVPYQIQKDLCQFSQTEIIDDHQRSFNRLKELMNNYCTPTPGKKLYITRTSRTPKRHIRSRSNTDYFLKEKAARVYEDEHLIEDFFVSKGFTVVDPSLMTVWEQQELFKDAEMVAAIKGTNIFNAAWMQKHQTVIILYTTKFWNYEFEHYFKHLKHIHVKPESWHSLSQQNEYDKTPVQDLIAECERLMIENDIL